MGSGGEAKLLIRAGQVRVNGVVEERPGAKIRVGDEVHLDTDPAACLRVTGT